MNNYSTNINSKYGKTGERMWNYRNGIYRYFLKNDAVYLGKIKRQSWHYHRSQIEWSNWFLSLERYLFTYAIIINCDVPDFQKYLIPLITNLIETDFEKFVNLMETHKNTTIDVDVGRILAGFGEGICL